MKGKIYPAVRIRCNKLDLLIKQQRLHSGYSSFDEILGEVRVTKDDAEWLIATLSRHFFNKRVILSEKEKRNEKRN
jgi:hypothetical protein